VNPRTLNLFAIDSTSFFILITNFCNYLSYNNLLTFLRPSHIFRSFVIGDLVLYSGENVVETYELTKRFEEVIAVNSVSFKIPKGTIYGLIGPNGAGKTTLLRMLVGILRPNAGRGFILGKDITSLSPEDRSRIGYMTQHKALYRDLTARENIDYFARINGVKDLVKRRKLVDNIIDLLEIDEWADRLVEQLSGGAQQLVSLACALVHEPEVIVLDEPTVGINPILRKKFWGYFRSLRDEGKTLIITTHYIDEAEHCDIIALMHNGRFIAEGKPNELRERVVKEHVLVINVSEKFADTGILSRIAEKFNTRFEIGTHQIFVYFTSFEILPDLLVELRKVGLKMISIDLLKLSLEDVFTRLISSQGV